MTCRDHPCLSLAATWQRYTAVEAFGKSFLLFEFHLCSYGPKLEVKAHKSSTCPPFRIVDPAEPRFLQVCCLHALRSSSDKRYSGVVCLNFHPLASFSSSSGIMLSPRMSDSTPEDLRRLMIGM